MTGSESPSSSRCSKGSRPLKTPQQQKEDSCKTEVMAPTDQLRRLAIKNSYGSKTVPPSSPLLLSRAISSSTSSLHQLESLTVPVRAELKPDVDTADCKKSSIGSQKKKQDDQQPKNGRCNPYITRQELLHSLRRTSSNHSVGMMQTICCGTSSYIHHTPRHLTRTHFNPKAPLTRTATVTPDSGFLSSDEASISGDKAFDRFDDCAQETQSLVNMVPSSRLSPIMPPIMPPRRSRQKQRSPIYVGMDMMDLGHLVSALVGVVWGGGWGADDTVRRSRVL